MGRIRKAGLLSLLFLSACALPIKREDSLRFLALGDSYTVGEGVDASDSWPAQTTRLLRQEDVPMGNPEIIAQTGWTTADLKAAMRENRLQAPYDAVGLLIGVNNQFRGLPLEIYRQEFKEILEEAMGLVSGHSSRVLVFSIPDWSVTPFARGQDTEAISQDIERFNDINRQEAEAAGATYIYITPMTRRAQEEPNLLTTDGLHPSRQMYAEWADRAASAIRVALKK